MYGAHALAHFLKFPICQPNSVSSFTRMSTSTVDLINQQISDWYEVFGSHAHLVMEHFYRTRIAYSDIHYADTIFPLLGAQQ